MKPAKTDTTAVRAQWARQGYSCDLWIDPPDQVWHDRQHDVDARVFLLEGDCQVEMNGRTLRLQTGDELHIPSGVRHTVRNCGEGPARWLHGFQAARLAEG